MKALSLVCHLFRALCLRHLFECIWLPSQFPLTREQGRLHWLEEIVASKTRALLVATCVQRCVLVGTPDDDESTGSLSPLDVMWTLFRRTARPQFVTPTNDDLLVTLGALLNLAVLHLHRFPMSMALFRALAAMPNLSVLKITECWEVLEPPTLDAAVGTESASIVVLEVTDCGTDGGSDFDAYIPLIVQLVNQRHLRTLSSDIIAVLDALTLRETPPIALEHLAISVAEEAEEYPPLTRYMVRCSNLKSLSVRTPAETEIPEGACVELESLACLPSVASCMLSATRPISTLKLYSGLEPDELDIASAVIDRLSVTEQGRPFSLNELALDFWHHGTFPPKSTIDVQTFTIVTCGFDFDEELMRFLVRRFELPTLVRGSCFSPNVYRAHCHPPRQVSSHGSCVLRCLLQVLTNTQIA